MLDIGPSWNPPAEWQSVLEREIKTKATTAHTSHLYAISKVSSVFLRALEPLQVLQQLHALSWDWVVTSISPHTATPCLSSPTQTALASDAWNSTANAAFFGGEEEVFFREVREPQPRGQARLYNRSPLFAFPPAPIDRSMTIWRPL